MREWQVLRDGKVWNDRFDSEDLAIENMEECILKYESSEFEVVEMSDEELAKYL